MSTKELEELLDAVDLTMDRLKTLYEQYFLGIQKQAPSFIHNDVERKLRDLTQMSIRNTGLRYRLATLTQKFGSYNSYWRRTLRQIENGTYARNLAKLGRDAARTGSDIPEEILAKMPKRMREQVIRDRDAAIAIAKRRKQGEDGEAGVAPAPDSDDDVTTPTSEPPLPRVLAKTASGAHVLADDDDDLDFDKMFAAFSDDDAPKIASPGSAGARSEANAERRLIETPKPAPKPEPTPQPMPQPTPDVRAEAKPDRRDPTSQEITRLVPKVPMPAPARGPTPASPPGMSPPSMAPPSAPRTPGAPTTQPTTALPRIAPAGPASPTSQLPRVAGPNAPTMAIPKIPGPPGSMPRVPPPAPTSTVPRVPPPAPAAPPPARPTPAGVKPPAPAGSLRPPPGMTEADVNALHAKYVKAKEAVGEKVDASSREKLLRTINQTAPKIMEQYKASGVDFSVVVKDNQVVIKAKPKT